MACTFSVNAMGLVEFDDHYHGPSMDEAWQRMSIPKDINSFGELKKVWDHQEGFTSSRTSQSTSFSTPVIVETFVVGLDTDFDSDKDRATQMRSRCYRTKGHGSRYF